ncbi:aminopeptidase [Bacillus sp. 166amftsu]|uniref:aminopeptidase n=1 Tax=Bacillus sp. 166amftsu TaxID=1761753 RepID=UPI00089C46B1|nr:aminopeptidase [Bacillus sp. 166amftsu]SDZ37938.1 Leucyl aminopeptidase (aminopeptidase T) [Bacillus sp. 166amftsu]
MMEEFNISLAEKLLHYSLDIKKGDNVFIDVYGQCEDFIEILIQKVYEHNGTPYLYKTNLRHLKTIIKNCDIDQMKLIAKNKLQIINNMDAFISIREDRNLFEFNDLPPDKYNIYTMYYQQPIQMAMASINRWMILKYPTHGMAQHANMSFSQLLLMYQSAAMLNYTDLYDKVLPLKKILDSTKHIKILSENTDLEFTKHNIPSFICDGKYNLPDGEIFTAPNLNSVNGNIAFNIPSSVMGKTFNNVKLKFENGRVVDFECDNPIEFGNLIYSDSGACRVGEFGIGLNPNIRKPTNNILFDEKMLGSIHIALGQCFPMTENGNKSKLHFDLVQSHLKNYGTGDLYFDGKLIRKDGRFILPELEELNFI